MSHRLMPSQSLFYIRTKHSNKHVAQCNHNPINLYCKTHSGCLIENHSHPCHTASVAAATAQNTYIHTFTYK